MKLARILELITDPTTGRISHTKLWANIGCAGAVAVFVKQGWTGTLSEGVWAFYLAGICGAAAVSKLVSYRYAGQPAEGKAPDA